MSYTALVHAGWCPIWTGVAEYEDVDYKLKHKDLKFDLLIKFIRDGEVLWHIESINANINVSDLDIALKRTAMNPGSNVGLLPTMNSSQDMLRLSSLLGYSPLCSPSLQPFEMLKMPSNMHYVGLDIEQCTSFRNGGFPLPTDPLICICIVSSKGKFYCRYSLGYADQSIVQQSDDYDVQYVETSTEMVDWAICLLQELCGDFIFIHNGFQYDIPVMSAHCSPCYGKLFEPMRLGRKGVGANLNIRGSTVVDTLAYIAKHHSGRYKSMSLASLALECKLLPKRDMPSMRLDIEDFNNNDLSNMIVYCMHDAYLHIAIAEGTEMIDEILSLSPLFRSPLNDVTRFISGTMVCSLASSYALSKGILIDWSMDPSSYTRYLGGFVMDPLVGVYSNVAVFDFKSLYPSIIAGVNISPENVVLFESEDTRIEICDELGFDKHADERAVQYAVSEDVLYLMIGQTLGAFSTSRASIGQSIMKQLVDRRAAPGVSSTKYGWSLKIGANSYYGAFGSKTSGMQCKFCASATTAVGRLVINELIQFVSSMNKKVIYGDTDSVFVELSQTSDIEELMAPQLLRPLAIHA